MDRSAESPREPESGSYREAIKRDWLLAPYYQLAEGSAPLDVFWAEGSVFRRCFEKLDLDSVVELACGWGRHAEFVREVYRPGRITLVDINRTNIEHCRVRFAGDERFTFVVNSGRDLADLPSNSYSALYSYDSMVHFEYDDVFAYLGETYRVLRPGGRALLHHSNNERQPGSAYSENPHWRNFMSAPFFAHVAMRTGFTVLEQHTIDWGPDTALDALTLLEKPASATNAEADGEAHPDVPERADTAPDEATVRLRVHESAIAERDVIIGRLAAQLAQHESWRAEITGTRAWRLMHVLWRIREIVAPRRGFMARLVGRMGSVADTRTSSIERRVWALRRRDPGANAAYVATLGPTPDGATRHAWGGYAGEGRRQRRARLRDELAFGERRARGRSAAPRG